MTATSGTDGEDGTAQRGGAGGKGGDSSSGAGGKGGRGGDAGPAAILPPPLTPDLLPKPVAAFIAGHPVFIRLYVPVMVTIAVIVELLTPCR